MARHIRAATRVEQAVAKRARQRVAKNTERMAQDFGLAETPTRRALMQSHVDRLVAYIRELRAAGRPPRQKKPWTPAVFDLIAGVPDENIGLAALYGVMSCMRVPPQKDDDGMPKERGPARAAKEVIGA